MSFNNFKFVHNPHSSRGVMVSRDYVLPVRRIDEDGVVKYFCGDFEATGHFLGAEGADYVRLREQSRRWYDEQVKKVYG